MINKAMLEKLELILNKSWDIKTCSPIKKEYYSNNKSLGQCAITAMIINDYLGGEIRSCYVEGVSHYYNFVDNQIIDLTKNQFNDQNNIDYSKYKIKSKEELLANFDTKTRYDLLSKRVAKYFK